MLQLLSGLVIPDTVEPSDAGTQTDTRRVFVSMFYGYHVVQGSPDRSPFFLFSWVVAACDKRLNNGKLSLFLRGLRLSFFFSLYLSLIDASYGAINKPKIVFTKSKHDHKCKQ